MSDLFRLVMVFVLCTFGSFGCQTLTGSVSGRDNSGNSSDTQPRADDHGHRDLENYIARMESPDRQVWQKPEQVIAALQLEPGEKVADLGCGPGYFTLPVAKAVGPQGRVWAVDIEPRMLERVRQHTANNKLQNIEMVLAQANDPHLPEGQVDTILIVNTYHHFNYRPVYVSKLRRALAPGGRVVIIDFVPKPRAERGFGPPLEMQLSRKVVDAELATSGFYPAVEHTFLPEQYFVEYLLKE